MLNKSGESGHPWLVPDLRRNAFSFSPLSMMLAVGFSYMVFTVLRYVPSMSTFWSFYHISMLNIIKSFIKIPISPSLMTLQSFILEKSLINNFIIIENTKTASVFQVLRDLFILIFHFKSPQL